MGYTCSEKAQGSLCAVRHVVPGPLLTPSSMHLVVGFPQAHHVEHLRCVIAKTRASESRPSRSRALIASSSLSTASSPLAAKPPAGAARLRRDEAAGVRVVGAGLVVGVAALPAAGADEPLAAAAGEAKRPFASTGAAHILIYRGGREPFLVRITLALFTNVKGATYGVQIRRYTLTVMWQHAISEAFETVHGIYDVCVCAYAHNWRLKQSGVHVRRSVRFEERSELLERVVVLVSSARDEVGHMRLRQVELRARTPRVLALRASPNARECEVVVVGDNMCRTFQRLERHSLGAKAAGASDDGLCGPPRLEGVAEGYGRDLAVPRVNAAESDACVRESATRTD
eukprot:6207580-Pleurochrysis_carterae.AAC.1